MTTKEKLVWRLSKLPTPEELRDLVKDKIITQEEAREVLFSKETIEDRDQESLKSEIKFLRELCEKLSSKSQTIETIKYVEKPYIQYEWYRPYATWCVSNSNLIGAGTTNVAYYGGGDTVLCSTSSTGDFSSISTF